MWLAGLSTPVKAVVLPWHCEQSPAAGCAGSATLNGPAADLGGHTQEGFLILHRYPALGGVAGLAALARSSALMFVLVSVLWLVWRRRLALALALALAAAFAVSAVAFFVAANTGCTKTEAASKARRNCLRFIMSKSYY